MTGANCSQRLGGRTLSEFPAFHTVLLLSYFYSRQATLCKHYSWDQFKEVHFHWNAIFIIQLKPKGQIPYQYKHLGVLMQLWKKQAARTINTCETPKKCVLASCCKIYECKTYTCNSWLWFITVHCYLIYNDKFMYILNKTILYIFIKQFY